jgi:hypothetical protein
MLSKGPKREFTKARHAQRRELAKACREVAKGTPWRSNQGVLFADRGGWFVAVHEMTNILREETKARIVVKPMAIDPIFWDLVGEPQLRSQSLSFRYFGALTCAPLILGEPEVSEDGGVIAIAQRLLALGEAKLGLIAASWTADDFLHGIQTTINSDRLLVSTIATWMAEGRDDEALAQCDQAVARRDPCGFVGARGSFPQTAGAWIRAKQQPTN